MSNSGWSNMYIITLTPLNEAFFRPNVTLKGTDKCFEKKFSTSYCYLHIASYTWTEEIKNDVEVKM